MPYLLKVLNVILFAGVKFFYTPIYAFAIGLDYWSAYFALVTGGILSYFVFYFATDIFLVYVRHFKPVVIKVTPHSTRLHYRNWKEKRSIKRSNRNKFTWLNRFIVKIRVKWGMWGIILSGPLLISIPVAAFLLRKYFGHQQKVALPAMIIAILIVGFVLNTMFWFIIKGIY